MNSAVTTALRSRRFRVWPLSLLLLGFVGGTTAAMAGSCDCKLASLPVCAQGTAKKPFDLQLLSGDGQLGVLQGYLQLRRSLIETAPARRLEVERRVNAWLGHPLVQINPIRLDALDQAVSAKLARLGAEVQMVNPASPPDKPGQPVAFAPGAPQVLDQSGSCSRPWTAADRLPDKGVSPLLAGTDFPEVGRIYYRSGVDTNHCSFTLLSRRWAVTALHCLRDTAMPTNAPQIVEDFQSPASLNRMGFFLSPDGATPLQSITSCFDNLPGHNSKACPLHRIEVLRALFKKPVIWTGSEKGSPLPQSDLTLLELKSTSLPEPVRSAAWGGAPVASAPKTLVASGMTTDQKKDAGYELQVGYIPGGQLSVDLDPHSRVFTWKNPSDGVGTAVCPSDSGGAVFDGWEDGQCRCTKGRPIIAPQRSLFAVVSYRRSTENKAGCVRESTSAAVVLSEHREWICQQAPDLDACQSR